MNVPLYKNYLSAKSGNGHAVLMRQMSTEIQSLCRVLICHAPPKHAHCIGGRPSSCWFWGPYEEENHWQRNEMDCFVKLARSFSLQDRVTLHPTKKSVNLKHRLICLWQRAFINSLYLKPQKILFLRKTGNDSSQLVSNLIRISGCIICYHFLQLICSATPPSLLSNSEPGMSSWH